MNSITRESIIRILFARRNSPIREYRDLTRSLIRWHIEQIRDEQLQQECMGNTVLWEMM